MKVSTRGRYAIRFLIDIGEREEQGFITLKEIADRQDISRKYLEQIVPILNQAGLLKANRGYKGGYRLGRPADEITVADVLKATGRRFGHQSLSGKGFGRVCENSELSVFQVVAGTGEGRQRLFGKHYSGRSHQRSQRYDVR